MEGLPKGSPSLFSGPAARHLSLISPAAIPASSRGGYRAWLLSYFAGGTGPATLVLASGYFGVRSFTFACSFAASVSVEGVLVSSPVNGLPCPGARSPLWPALLVVKA